MPQSSRPASGKRGILRLVFVAASLSLMLLVAMVPALAAPPAIASPDGPHERTLDAAAAATEDCATAQAAVDAAKKKVKKAKRKLKKAKRKLKKAKREGAGEKKARKKLKKAKRKLKKAKKERDAALDAQAAACAEPEPAPWVALGDSVTATGGYQIQLSAHYRSTLGVTEVLNRARGGESSGSLRTGGQLTEALADIDAASDTRVVTITIGGKDSLEGCDWASPSCAFRANFDAILDALQQALAADPGAEPLIALAYYNPYDGLATEGQAAIEGLGANGARDCADTGADLGLNDVISQVADQHQALVADAYPPFVGNNQTFMADAVHANAAGNAAIAEAFRQAGPPCAA